ncbi:MAG TPA: hypothetical protein VF168_11285 [Trueperaceae bacterium]
MRTNDPLRLPLTIAAAYVLIAGVVLLFPSVSQAVFGRTTLDPAVETLYGVALVNIGAIYAVLVGQKQRSSSLVWIQIGGLLLAAVVMVLYWSMGDFSARTILVPILLNLLLGVWIGAQTSKARLPGTRVTGA